VDDLDLLIRAARAVVDGEESACAVAVRDGRIVDVLPYASRLPARSIVELYDDVLLPGIVDTHVHVNEPGRTEWEGFSSATRAAAAGGVTTIVDMPLNSIPPTTTLGALRTKRRAAEGKVYVDVGFWGGAVPGNLADLAPLDSAGVMGFKCFLIDSGVQEFPPLDPAGFAAAMTETARLGALMVVHAEDAAQIDDRLAVGTSYTGFLSSRPPMAESVAVARVIEQARVSGSRTHLLHLSSADAVPQVRDAREAGLPLSVETCPHYLFFDAEGVPDGATEFKCCPPIRGSKNRSRLWEALGRGDIDTVVSDHSPCTLELKQRGGGDFAQAWGGIASMQLSLAAVWTAAREHGHSLTDVVRWMATGPADQVRLSHKGRIAPGADADFCVLAPDDEFVVDVARLHHKNPVSAYAGRTLTGVVRETWLRGERVDIDGTPRGRLLTKGQR
jgi:allantoinase